MKPITSSRRTTYIPNLHHIHYLRTGNSSLHKPSEDNKGLHCTGDRFGYIVDWQVSEKKREIIMPK